MKKTSATASTRPVKSWIPPRLPWRISAPSCGTPAGRYWKSWRLSSGRRGASRILQEDVITEREGRYVILVKMEHRHEVKGIVHDISNTGATVFMEPTATVGLGNALRELVIEERREIEKVLRLLSAEVGAHADDITRSIELTAELDFILAKARYAAEH